MLTKSKQVTHLSTELGVSKKEADKIYEAFSEMIFASLLSEEEVQIGKSGKLKLKMTAQKTSYLNDQKHLIPARKKVYFGESKHIKDFFKA